MLDSRWFLVFVLLAGSRCFESINQMRSLVVLITGLFLCLGALPAAATIDASLQMQLGNPSNATVNTNNHAHYLIQRTVEALDYSDNLGEPVWASWDLTSGDVGPATRSTSFYTDTNLPPNFYRVTDNDYLGVGAINFSRGHLCPSEDRTDNSTNNKLVFFMSNIMPQSGPNNSGVWATFEKDCRSLLTNNELLIICGPSGFGTNTIPSGKAYIGSNTWKVVVCVPLGGGTALSRITATNRVIAISVPNVTNGLSSSWQTYVTSPAQIEQATGLTFFTAVPADIAAVFRSKVDGSPMVGITSLSPASGHVGSSTVITGTNFVGLAGVWFNGTNAAFTLNSSNQITAIVPAGATTGPVSLIANGGLATSTGNFVVSTPAAPVLSIQPAGRNALVISWPSSATGFALQQNSSLTTNWANVTNAITTTGGTNQIILPMTSGNNFFRLAK